MEELDFLIERAGALMHIVKRPGHTHSISLSQVVKLILIKQPVGKSNRMFPGMHDIFSMFSGTDMPYKTID